MTRIPQTSERPPGARPREGCEAELLPRGADPLLPGRQAGTPPLLSRGGRSPDAPVTVKGWMAGRSGAGSSGTGSGPLSAGSSLGQLRLQKGSLVKLPEPQRAAPLSPPKAAACK